MSGAIRNGEMVSWGALAGTPGTDLIVFSGEGALSNVRSAWPQRWTLKYVNPLTMATGLLPVDTAGYGPMPLASPIELVYDYIFLAPATYTDGQAFKYVETQMNQINTFIQSTYTLDGVSGTSGMKGWIVTRDANPAISTRYKAKARVLDGPSFENVKGQPSELHITLTFGLTSFFTEVT